MKPTVFIILIIAGIALAEPSFTVGKKGERPIIPYINRVVRVLPTNHRFPRSPNPEPQGFGTFNAHMQGNALNLDYQRRIIDNNRGSLSASVGALKVPGQSLMTNVGVQGTYRFPHPNHPASITGTWQKNLNGPERRPSYGLGYEQTIFQNRHGSIGVSAGAQRFPGQRWQPNVGIGGRFRFRRSADEIDQQE